MTFPRSEHAGKLDAREAAAADEPPAVRLAAGFGAARVVIKSRKAGPVRGHHPWVFGTAIAGIEGDCGDGDIVEVVSEKGRFLARGLFHSTSHLRLRLYTWDPQQLLNDAFWHDRIERAIRLRERLGLLEPDAACRLVSSEADGLSGLIVDRFGDHLVIQVTAAAIAARLDTFVRILSQRLSPASILVRTEPAIAKAEGIAIPEGCAFGKPPEGPVFIVEHGLRYGVDLQGGQKTGCYLDQRGNRRAAAGYLRGRRVLDLFCYTGGFSLCSLRLGGAREALGVDSSERAVAWARANAELNGVHDARFERGDCFAFLARLRDAGERFDAVILDPPKFAPGKRSVADAIRAYHRINRLAVELLPVDGVLVTCSCSGSVSREDFLRMLAAVAAKSGREIQVLEQRGAAADHPLNPACPESEYLKCFICRVV